jgi:Cu-Zn family superoxide dismutase
MSAGRHTFGHAGGHYNPESTGHGFMDNDGVHAGDMPNLHIPASGELKFEVFNPLVKLDERLFDEDGASIMIHAGADDYVSNPAGDAGSRIACGVIERNQ